MQGLLSAAATGTVTSGLLWAITTYKAQGKTAQAAGTTCLASLLIAAISGVGGLSCLIPLYFAQQETNKAQQLAKHMQQILHPEVKSLTNGIEQVAAQF